ncbi:MAG: hypothetical protein FJY29_06125 [Betaproteobacteria bacterium]|nr:hypothetical protein [Betaproteobacteria bacterium]
MGSVSSIGMIWMIMVGVLATSLAYFIGFLWQTSAKVQFIRKKRNSLRSLLRLPRAGRGSRLKRFEQIAVVVVTDVESALQPPLCSRHARSFLPILSDVRRRGQLLLSQQTGAHRVSAPERERHLYSLVDKLGQLEIQLKALPKPNVTVEEVLLGKFE